MGLCRNAACRADGGYGPDRPCRADVILQPGALPAGAAHSGTGGNLWRGWRARLGRGISRSPEVFARCARDPIAVLGFGDRSFPAYCAFAQAVAEAAEAAGWKTLVPFDTVDRQSTQDFTRWGRALGAALGIELELAISACSSRLAADASSRHDYGAEVQSPTVILRFELPKVGLIQRVIGHGFGRFAAGDLLGVLPEGSVVPRFYSLASAHRDGFVEIVVKKHPAGLCSGQLFELQPGATINAFLKLNPGFQPDRSRAPLILIGAARE